MATVEVPTAIATVPVVMLEVLSPLVVSKVILATSLPVLAAKVIAPP